MRAGAVILLIVCTPVLVSSQERYSVVIDEIMADPSPQVALPNNEWVELKNVGGSAINLQGWRIADATSQSGMMPSFVLQPDSFVIVCTSNAVPAMSAFGAAISVSGFPSLDNDADQVVLRASTGRTIHAVSYSISWYHNQLKREGGWTLEMIDTRNSCSGASNWRASVDPAGGTPARKNSIDGINADQSPPRLRYAYMADSTSIIGVFDEPVDSVIGANASNYFIDQGFSITTAATIPPLFNMVQLKLNAPLLPNTIYTLTAKNIADCGNNLIGTANKARVGLPADPSAQDVVINEILFNPRSNGFDYVEFYNQSNKTIDALKLFAANRNSADVISSIRQIFSSPFYIFPDDYLVITEDAASLQMNYLVKNLDALITLPSLPSYPDDEGDVVLLDGQGNVVDEVKYKDDWHFKLLADPQGVSLERIDPAGPSQDADNWHSAASTAGYGTPGYKNSQYKQPQPVSATIDIVPKTFSPDNDGHDDVATIQYKVTEPGYIANITIYDSQGRPVRYLVKNGTLGINGQWNWDGLDEKQTELPIGPYIVYTEIFNLRGKQRHFRNVVVLARKLN